MRVKIGIFRDKAATKFWVTSHLLLLCPTNPISTANAIACIRHFDDADIRLDGALIIKGIT